MSPPPSSAMIIKKSQIQAATIRFLDARRTRTEPTHRSHNPALYKKCHW